VVAAYGDDARALALAALLESTLAEIMSSALAAEAAPPTPARSAGR
jgi:hypothetical protein